MNTRQSIPAPAPSGPAPSTPVPPFEQYDFAADVMFQAGLESILAGVATDSEKAAATAKAKRFYYARITSSAPPMPVEVDQREQQREQLQQEGDSNAPRYPASFAEIVQMVAEGKPIPGVRDIPNSVADVPPSQPSLKPRLKPWETAAASKSSSSPTSS